MSDPFETQEPGAAAQNDLRQPEPSQEELDRQKRAQAIAEFNAHPHTQLTGILSDLRKPSGLDINGRVATLHSAVARLTQLMLGAGEPPVHPDNQKDTNDGKGWQDESARGS